MTGNARMRLTAWMLIVVACAAAGCNYLAFPAYFLSPSRGPRTIDAEFDGLDDVKVAVVIMADDSLINDYEYFRARLAGIIGKELMERLDDVTVVEPGRIVKYQDNDVDWKAIDRPTLAKKFGADYLLQVMVQNYALTASNSQTLYRGNIRAHVALFDAKRPANKASVWRGAVEATYPKQGHLVGRINNATQEFRLKTERLFAENLVKKFRSHKEEK